MFSIRITAKLDRDRALAELCIGDYVAELEVVAESWTLERHEAQWHGAACRLAAGAPNALFITSLRGEAGREELGGWACYREDHEIIFQPQILSADLHALSWDGDQLGFLEPRESFSDYGLPIEEWRVPLAEVLQFVSSPKSP